MPLFSYTGDFDFLRWKPKKIYKNLGVLKNGVNPPCFSDHENTAGKKGILISNFEKIPPEITGVLIFCRVIFHVFFPIAPRLSTIRSKWVKLDFLSPFFPRELVNNVYFSMN